MDREVVSVRSFVSKCLSSWKRQLGIVRTSLTLRWSRLSAYLREATETNEICDILANEDPFEFVKQLGRIRGHSWSNDEGLDFSHLNGHDFGYKTKQLPFEWSSESEVAHFIALLAWNLKPKNVIEVGSFVGFTSCHIALALECIGDGTLYCVDEGAEYLDILSNNIESLGLRNRIRIIHGSSLDPAVLDSLPKAEIIFIDSSHHYETTKREIEEYSQKIAKPGYLVLHDSVRYPGVRRAVAEHKGKKMTFATSQGCGATVLPFEN
jgi:predicted O-methyltransferase YrrM